MWMRLGQSYVAEECRAVYKAFSSWRGFSSMGFRRFLNSFELGNTQIFEVYLAKHTSRSGSSTTNFSDRWTRNTRREIYVWLSIRLSGRHSIADQQSVTEPLYDDPDDDGDVADTCGARSQEVSQDAEPATSSQFCIANNPSIPITLDTTMPISSTCREQLSMVKEKYCTSAQEDIDEIVAVTREQMSMVRDHVRQLQMDPEYFHHYVQPVYLEDSISGDLNLIATDLDHDVWTLRHWEWILRSVTELEYDFVSVAKGWIHMDWVRLDFNRQLARVEHLVLRVIQSQSARMQSNFPRRPGFCHLYDFCHTDNGAVSFTRKSTTDSGVQEHANDQLDHMLQSFSSLEQISDQQGALDRLRLFRELELYLQQCPKEERSRVDEVLRLLTLLRAYRPRSTFIMQPYDDQPWMANYSVNIPGDPIYPHKLIIEEHARDWKPYEDRLRTFLHSSTSPNVEDGDSLRRFDTSHEALTNFWEATRDGYIQRFEEVFRWFKPSHINSDLLLWCYDKCPGYAEDLEAERQWLLAYLGVDPSRLAASDSRSIESAKIPKVGGRTQSPCIQEELLVKKVLSETGWGKAIEVVDVKTRRDHGNGYLSKTTEKQATKPMNAGNRDREPYRIQTEWGDTPPNYVRPPSPKKKIRNRPPRQVQEPVEEEIAPTEPSPPGDLPKFQDNFVTAMKYLDFGVTERPSGGYSFEPNERSPWFGAGRFGLHIPPNRTFTRADIKWVGYRM
ncbi:hypothetical protein DL98DRAFT_613312 [Cadophora sp. DSE1049]|nr:hypothetical protein DL98DRAFT_613312 [Cadophora sp. DSE1049]